ncbi:hypothetical protein FACS1894181_10840 [Bacteroidia bacterium]|nr:hypothetical protein FACS1894181_10840 [Bacteroidia bacterium]
MGKQSNIYLLLLLLLLAGCKSKQQVATVSTGTMKANADFFEAARKQVLSFTTFSARTTMDFRLPGYEASSRVDIKMVRDSSIQLSVQPFAGMEMFRLEFNRDSIKLLDRMNKQYILESYESIKGQSPIAFNFYNIQALFTNNIFAPGARAITPRLYDRFRMRQDGGLAELQIKDAARILYTFVADGEEKLLSTHITDPEKRYNLKWQYSDFRLTEGKPFPMQMNMQAANDGRLALGVGISFSRIQRDVPVSLDFPIPKSYKRVTLAALMKGLGVK